MAITIMLELPDEVAQRARAAAERAGLPLEALLADWLARAAALDATGLAPGMTYPVLTPFGNDAAASVLLAVLEADTARHSPAGRP